MYIPQEVKGNKKNTHRKNELHIDIKQHRFKSKLTMVKATHSCCGRFFEKKQNIPVQVLECLKLIAEAEKNQLAHIQYTRLSAFKRETPLISDFFYGRCFTSAYTNTALDASSVYSYSVFRRLYLCLKCVSLPVSLYDVCSVYACVCDCQWWVESAWLVLCVGGQADSTLLPTWQQVSRDRRRAIWRRLGWRKVLKILQKIFNVV